MGREERVMGRGKSELTGEDGDAGKGWRKMGGGNVDMERLEMEREGWT